MFRLPIIPQLELADLLNISQRTYSKIESGEIGVKIKRLQKIASFLNVTISKLLTDNTEMTLPVPINNKERNIYEKRILHQEKEIEFLRGLVKIFKG
jgi:transcriptional regulator with XRE-family HTH domain